MCFAPAATFKSLAAASLEVVKTEHDLTIMPAAGAGAPLPLLTGLPTGAAMRSEDGCAILGLQSPAGPTATADIPLGQLHASRFVALAKSSMFWMSPTWGTSADQVPPETQFLLLDLGGGALALLLPLIDRNHFRATVRPLRPGSKALVLRLESGAPSVTAEAWPSALLVAAGCDPQELLARGVAAAARLSGTARRLADKELPASVDVFGWCTWDAFYSGVSPAGIQAGLKSLAEGGTPARLLVIDDGWQRTDVDAPYRTAAQGNCTPVAAVGSVASLPGTSHSHSHNQFDDAAVELLAGTDYQTKEMVHDLHRREDEAATPLASSTASASPFSATSTATAAPAALAAAAASTSSATAAPAAAAPTAPRSLLARLGDAVCRGEAQLLRLLKALLDGAPSDSWRMRAFAAAAAGPLRGALLRFYARTTEHSRRLTSIATNAKFGHPSAGIDAGGLNSAPAHDGLAAVVASIKAQGVDYVYAWHAMMGFWAGIHPGGHMARYKATIVAPQPSPGMLEIDPGYRWVQSVLAGVGLPADPNHLHRDMHAYLSGAGIDGVKVDVQGALAMCGHSQGGGAAITAAYHRSLEASVGHHFPGNHLINCMCGSSEDIYRMEHSALARASDDYYPSVPASWCSHLANCAFNALFMGELLLPDWDMFHSQHSSGLLHATARAVSGGPVYVSDKPGSHDFALLRRLVLPDGSVLRARLPGRPTPDCLFSDVSHDGQSALKVWNLNACGGMVAVFNVQGQSWSVPHRGFHMHDPSPPSVTAAVSPADVPALAGAAQHEGSRQVYAAWSDVQQSFQLLQADDSVPVEVAPAACDLLTIAPVMEEGASGVCFAPIGLVNMLNAGGALLSCALSAPAEPADAAAQNSSTKAAAAAAPTAPLVALQLRGCGEFVAYSSHRPSALLLDGQSAGFSYDAEAAVLRFAVPAPAGPGLGTDLTHSCEVRF